MNSDVLAASVSSFAAGFLFSVSGIGGGVAFTACWTFLAEVGLGKGGMSAALLHLYIHNIFATAPVAIHLRKQIKWPFVFGVAAIWAAFQVLGTTLLFGVNELWLKRSIGGVLVLALLATVAQARGERAGRAREAADQPGKGAVAEAREAPLAAEQGAGGEAVAPASLEEGLSAASGATAGASFEAGGSPLLVSAGPPFNFGSTFNVCAAIVMGCCGGFFQGLCGIPMPGPLVYVLATGIPKDPWRASNSTVALLTVPLAAAHFVAVSKPDLSQWPAYLASAVANLVAFPVGNAVSACVGQRRFRQLVQLIMLGGSLLLLTSGQGVSAALAAAGVTLVLSVVVCSMP